MQAELQDVSDTVAYLQEAEGAGREPRVPPPPRPTFPRPARPAEEHRRAGFAESEADEAASAITGSDMPVQELVQAIQTSQKEADKIELPSIPEGNQFRTWRIAVREAVASASRDPKAAFLWIRKVEASAAVPADLAETDGFATLDSKLASALRKVVTGSLGRSINVEKEKFASSGQMMTGRQILLMIYNHFRVTEVDNNILDLEDLIAVNMNNDDLRRFYDEWEMTLTGIRKVPDEDWLETLLKSQIKGHPGLKEDMAYYNRLEKGHADRCYTFLLNCVRKSLERQRQDRAKAEHDTRCWRDGSCSCR